MGSVVERGKQASEFRDAFGRFTQTLVGLVEFGQELRRCVRGDRAAELERDHGLKKSQDHPEHLTHDGCQIALAHVEARLERIVLENNLRESRFGEGRYARRWSRVYLENLRRQGLDVVAITVSAEDSGPDEEWFKTVPLRWASLRRAAVRAAQSTTGHEPRLLARFWQPAASVPCLHVLVGCANAEERSAAAAFGDEVVRLASEYGFRSVA